MPKRRADGPNAKLLMNVEHPVRIEFKYICSCKKEQQAIRNKLERAMSRVLGVHDVRVMIEGPGGYV